MPRFLPLLIASLGAAIAVPSVHAAELSGGKTRIGTPAGYAAAPVSDRTLASIHGMGLVQPAFTRRMTLDYLQGLDRQAGQLMPVMFDNWFNDVGNALIFANQRAAG